MEVLELDPVPHMRPVRNDRCQQRTNSTGTPWYEDGKGQCARFARFKIGGRKLCAQHAGQVALQWLLEQSGGE